MDHFALLFLAIGVIAFLYSTVGHAGASGYIAVMALFGLLPETIRPTALALNILVAIIGTFQFWRAGYFNARFFWPFALLSIPAAFLGGYLHVSTRLLPILLGVVLILSAIRLFLRPRDPDIVSPPSSASAIITGGGIGFLSGLTGTGGGIFLTPLILFTRWAKIRVAAATSAAFILVNSIAGLVGYFSSHRTMPTLGFYLAGAALLGGAAGSYFGSRRFVPRTISILLALVLVIAGAKLLFSR